jgi:cysteinyl-tRNA synthetase
MYIPDVIRLYFLKSHYRSPQEIDFKILDSCKESWRRIQDFFLQTKEKKIIAKQEYVSNETIASFREALDNDLNTPMVISLIFEKVKDGFTFLANNSMDAVKKVYSEIQYYLNVLGFKDGIVLILKQERPKELSSEVDKEKELGRLKELARQHGLIDIYVSGNIFKAYKLSTNARQYEITNLLRDGLEEMGCTSEYIQIMIQDNVGVEKQHASLQTSEKELGFNMQDIIEISDKIVFARDLARTEKQYEISDLIRKGLEEMGYTLEDTDKGTRIKRK